VRAAIGLAAAAIVVLLARRARALAPSGAATAWLLGTTSVAAGWHWAALLIAFFGSGTALSRVGGARKARRLAPVVAKGGERDAVQVLANGGVFGLAALAHLVLEATPIPLAIGAGALAAAAADTFATEVGTLSTRPPRSILTGRPVPAGTSGGISLVGSLAMLAGAALLAALAALLAPTRGLFLAVLVGGVAGAVADSLLGATVQERRWCAACNAATERVRHHCGTMTRRVGGVAAVGNDAVNVACTAVGGLLAGWLVA